MNVNLIRIFLIVLMTLSTNMAAFCTELPANVVSYIQKEIPGSKVRFDGLIELPDSTNYVPVLPLVYNKNIETVDVMQTIPAGQAFSQKPDMILFNNNLALLKIIHKPGKAPTFVCSPDMPLKVKLGVLPQDLIVPRGLELPVDLKVILGDLKIPLKEKVDDKSDIAFQVRAEVGEVVERATAENSLAPVPEMEFLNEKKLYVLNHRVSGLELLDSQTGRIESVVDLPSTSFFMTLTPDERYMLLTAPALNRVFIVDTFDNEFVKSLQVGKLPSYVYCSQKTRKTPKAFIANGLSSDITEIDLKTMQVTRTIPAVGYPDNIQGSGNPNALFYNDRLSGKIYQLSLTSGESHELIQVDNISRMELFNDSLFILSRGDNTLTVFDLKLLEPQKKEGEDGKDEEEETEEERMARIQAALKHVPTGEKPLDFMILPESGKMIVVCAGSDALDVIDMEKLEVTNSVRLNSGGFPGGISAVKGQDVALISSYNGYEIIIYNIKDETVQGQIPVSHTVSRIIVSDR